jgi:predicted amidohydrolase
VAAVQMPSRLGDVEANSRRMERLARRAARRGADIVVFPEAAVTGYLSQDLKVNWRVGGRPLDPDFSEGRSPRRAAQSVPGPTVRRFARLARELAVYLVVPFVELDPQTGLYYNTACLLGPDGRLLLHYRKINPWPHPEDSWATAGHQLAVARTPHGKLGLLICFDIHTLPPRLASAGADVLLYPIAWVDDAGSSWFNRELPRIARRNRLAIVGANWSVESRSKNRDWHGAGSSRIIDPNGKILARARGDVGEEILYAELVLRTSR